ncbi:MAG TPA: GtrA family protein [Mycobacteriales bacterium]|nr:GtrA family protein [Mycobacteriales bacterium]
MLPELRFLVVGGTALLIDVGTLAGLRELANAPLVAAATTALVASLAWNYAAQRRLTFGSVVALRTGLPRYLFLVALNYVATLGLVTLGARTGAGYLTGKAAAVAVLTPTNFYAYRAWVFPTRLRSD